MGVKNNCVIFEVHPSSIAFPTLISWLANQGLYMCEPSGRQGAIEDNTQSAIAVENRLLYQAGWSVKIASNSDVSGFQLCSEKRLPCPVTSRSHQENNIAENQAIKIQFFGAKEHPSESNCSSHQVRAPVENLSHYWGHVQVYRFLGLTFKFFLTNAKCEPRGTLQ